MTHTQRICALVVAAGRGSRMGAAVNKAYLTLGDRPVLARTLNLFEAHPLVDQVVVVIHPDDTALFEADVRPFLRTENPVKVCHGGADRQASVRNGLAVLAPEDMVLVHDGARPLTPAQVLEDCIAAVRETGAACVALQSRDTVKTAGAEGCISGTLDRNGIWLAQTPQAFRVSLLTEAMRKAEGDGFSGTDDASLVERLGVPVKLVPGDVRNFKLTTPEDMAMARALI